MCNLNAFDIDLKGINGGEIRREYDVGDAFFASVGNGDVRKGNVHVVLSAHKESTCFEFSFHMEGTVTMPCDMCLDDMEYRISTDNTVKVRLACCDNAALADDDGDMITVDDPRGTFNAAWNIYEAIALAVPIRHVHELGKCNPQMLRVLDKYCMKDDIQQ